MSIGIDFGIGIDQNSWYRTGIVSKPKKLVSPITSNNYVMLESRDQHLPGLRRRLLFAASLLFAARLQTCLCREFIQ